MFFVFYSYICTTLQYYNNYKQETMKKKNLYEKPSLEVVVLEHKEMLMTSGNEVTRNNYGDPNKQAWSREYDWAREYDWEEEEEEE